MLSAKREQQVISLCQELIRIKSYSGEEKGVAQHLEKVFKELGFDNVYSDKYGNIMGHIKGKKPGNKLLFDAHMDTVPVTDPEKWSYDPFGGIADNGRIYGRGASDMKGALASMLTAAAFFAEDTGKDFSGEIYIAGIVHEECFEGVAAKLVGEAVKPDFVVIGEATELNLRTGQRGRAEIVLETKGIPAHSANPEKGINAVRKMMKLIGRIDQLEKGSHPQLGYGIMELTDIKSYPYPGASVVPESCRVTYDRRLLKGEKRESVLKPIIDIIKNLELEDSEFKAEAAFAKGFERCYTGEDISGERFFPAWLYDSREDYVKKILSSMISGGMKPEIGCYSFCTNGSYYAGEAGIKTIGFGPSRENLAHTVDEYVDTDQLLGAAKGYYCICSALLDI